MLTKCPWFLQDDLQHPDVRKALAHWTGERRMPKEEAEQLMEGNFRIQSVFPKLNELQHACRLAGISVPLACVINGTGLPCKEAPLNLAGCWGEGGAGEDQPGTCKGGHGSGTVAGAEGCMPRRVGGATPPLPVGSKGTEAVPSLSPSSRGRVSLTEPSSTLGVGAGGGGSHAGDASSWVSLLAVEVGKAMAVAVCAAVFALLLQIFRGDDPLGVWRDWGGSGSDGGEGSEL
ncbi:unnamed protein product [Discosporangium mesarthrocarpum]